MAITLSPIHENIQRTLIEKMNMLQKGLGSKDKDGEMKFGGVGGAGVIGESVSTEKGAPSFNYMFTRSVWLRMSSFVVNAKDQTPVIIEGGELDKTGNMRSGLVNRSVTLNKEKDEKLNFTGLYNLGDDLEQPYRPIAGVKDINVEYKGGGMRLGATRTATISWTCWTWDELERLKPFFLKHGRAVLLEWGWSYPGSDIKPFDFLKNLEGGVKSVDQDKIKNIITKVPEKVLTNKGQYDAIAGVIQNFEWNVRDDGGFDCTTTLVSMGVTLLQQAMKSNVKGKMHQLQTFTAADEKDWTDSVPGYRFWFPRPEVEQPENFNPYYNFQSYIKSFQNQLAINIKLSNGTILYTGPKQSFTKTVGARIEREKSYTHEFDSGPFCTWGWFEDNVLSRFCGNISSNDTISEFRSIENVYNADGTTKKDKDGNVITEPVQIRNSSALMSPNLNEILFFGADKPECGLVIPYKALPYMTDRGKADWKDIFYDGDEVGDPIPERWDFAFTDDMKKDNAVKPFTVPGTEGTKGQLRNIYFSAPYIRRFFEDEDDIIAGVTNLWKDFSNKFGGIYKFKIDYDDAGKRLLIRDEGWTRNSVKVIHEKKSQSNTGTFNKDYNNDGLFVFPIWEANSITKSQNLSAKLPQRMQMAAMYGANTKIEDKSTDNTTYDDYSALALGRLNEEETNVDEEQLYMDMASGKMEHAFMKDTAFGNVDGNELDSLGFYSGSKTQTNLSKIFEGDVNGVFTGLKDVVNDQMRDELQSRFVKKGMTEEQVKNFIEDKGETGLEKKLEEYKKNWKEKGQTVKFLYTEKVVDDEKFTYKKVLKLKEEYVSLMTMALKGGSKGVVKVTDPLVPLELEIEIDGTGGIFPGNAFHSSYLPNIYFKKTLFQAVGVSHKVDPSGWSTTIKGQMRVAAASEPVVGGEPDPTPPKLTDAQIFNNHVEFNDAMNAPIDPNDPSSRPVKDVVIDKLKVHAHLTKDASPEEKNFIANLQKNMNKNIEESAKVVADDKQLNTILTGQSWVEEGPVNYVTRPTRHD